MGRSARELTRRLTGLSVRGRLLVAFASVLILHTLVAGFGIFTTSHFERDVERTARDRRATIAALRIEHGVSELLRRIESPSTTLPELAIRDFERQLRSIRRQLQHRELSVHGKAVEELRESLTHISELYPRVLNARSERQELVDRRIPELFDLAHATVDDISERSSLDGSDRLDDLRYRLSDCELKAQRYSDRLEARAVNSAIGSLVEIRDALREVAGDDTADDPIEECRRALIGLLVHTRGILHLVHVVIAGEIADCLRATNAISARQDQRSDQLLMRLRTNQDDIYTAGLVFSIFTIVLAVAASSWVTRTTVRPLAQITEAFQGLAIGHQRVELPFRSRNDEIGALVNAAHVFKERNAETEALAHHSELLVRDLKIKNDQLQHFAHAASHDLRSPLRAISTLIEWIVEDHAKKLPAEAQDDLQTVQQRIHRMDQLLNDLLQYARSDAKRVPAETTTLGKWLDETLDLIDAPDGFEFRPQIQDRTIQLETGALTQVARNLIQNSIQHHDRAEGEIRIEVEADDEELRLTVTDDGPGIPTDLRGAAFEAFRTLATTNDRHSSGLGLALVRKIADSRNARIELGERPDGGSGLTARVYWPLRYPMTASSPQSLNSSSAQESTPC